MTLSQMPAPATVVPGAGSRRRRTVLTTVLASTMVLAVVLAGTLLTGTAADPELGDKLRPPSGEHLFGTDWLGRDLLARVLVGLRLSLFVGLLAAAGSTLIALALAGVALTCGRFARAAVQWLVDLFLSLPHLVLLILVSFALGGGTRSVVIAVAVTHWPTLTRVLIAKGSVVVASDYDVASRSFGHGPAHVARHHLLPHLLPHALVGGILLFPHAVLHEAALSFLGLGIDPAQPAVGVLMKDSMRYLSTGEWWLALLPGVCLLVLVKMVDHIGDNLRLLNDPRSHHA